MPETDTAGVKEIAYRQLDAYRYLRLANWHCQTVVDFCPDRV